MNTILQTPVDYSPALEHPEANEAETALSIQQTLQGIIETTSKHTGHGYRALHAKSHALLEGILTVATDLPHALAQGLFAKPGAYKTFMRFSTISGDILDDKVSLPRGLAIKVVGVEGERLPGSEGESVQDFLFTNGPTFSTSTASDFLGSLELVAKTTDQAEWAKLALSSVVRGVESVLETTGSESPTLMVFGGYEPTNPAGDHYFSQTPFRFGDHVAKFSLVPSSANLLAMHDVKLDLTGGPDEIRTAMIEAFAEAGGSWELKAQLLTDVETMPVEDSSVPWPEDQSAYVTVARIDVRPQSAWNDERSAAVDDGMAFDPWNGLAAHQPLGSINRVRKSAYAMSSDVRGKINGCPVHAVTTTTTLPI